MKNNFEADKRNAYIKIHFAVFLWGFTAILGKLIELSELPLVWFRVILTCASLLLFPNLWKNLKGIPSKSIIKMSVIGIIICTHWIFFYASIKYSNASVALCCISTVALFTSFLEPVLFGKKISKLEIMLGLLVIAGIYTIFHFSWNFKTGIILGLIASFFSSLFTILNKRIIENIDTIIVTFTELVSGWLFMTLLLPFYFIFFPETKMLPSPNDWMYLLFLSLGCTTLPYLASISSLKHISAFSSNLVLNLEPIYGIILAVVILNENKDLNSGFYTGAIMIMISVFIHSYYELIVKRKKTG
jgi:drug/metabolite transporter (DMT)-like permease